MSILTSVILEFDLAPFEIIEVIFGVPDFSQEFATIYSKDRPDVNLPQDRDRTKDKTANDDGLDFRASDPGVGEIIGALLILPLLIFI